MRAGMPSEPVQWAGSVSQPKMPFMHARLRRPLPRREHPGEQRRMHDVEDQGQQHAGDDADDDLGRGSCGWKPSVNS